MIALGVVADDVTGACDLAGTTAEAGLRTLVCIGVPEESVPDDIDCVVVAQKTRTADPTHAAEEAFRAATWLRRNGAEWLYQKYCSTFDSTDRGNIGPIADALAEAWTASAVDTLPPDTRSADALTTLTIGTPATPAVGRTQYQGHLFVYDRLLSESSLRTHPLTPMHDPDLVRVLSRQTPGPVGLVRHDAVRRGADVVRRELAARRAAGAAHVLVDALDDGDLDVLAEATDDRGFGGTESGSASTDPGGRAVLAGGAGFAAALARRLAGALRPGVAENALPVVGAGRRLVLSGSGSERTREQVAAFDHTTLALDVRALARDASAEVERVCAALRREYDEHPDRPVLVTATAEPHEVNAIQQELGVSASAALVEDALAELAAVAVASLGATRVIVAGGETSGAVTSRLGVRMLRVAGLAAPGVPWMVATVASAPIALLLKSGNFGEMDLFTAGFEVAP